MEAPSRFRRYAEADDPQIIMATAGLLRIREFDLFRLAWCRWRGEQPDERALEKVFVAYMFRQCVPPWVRHFCREVLARERDGRLDPRDFGVERVARRQSPVSVGNVFLASLLAGALALFPILASPSQDTRGAAALACESGPGLRIFAGLAHALAGRDPPACPRAGREPPGQGAYRSAQAGPSDRASR